MHKTSNRRTAYVRTVWTPWSLVLMGALVAVLWAGSAQAQNPIVLSGDVPDNGQDFFFLPFEVPAGTAEIEIRHDDLSDANILDWGVQAPDGSFRGWGGGNSEPAILGTDRASRSYLAGELTPGTWEVVVGKAKIAEPPGSYYVEVELRDTPTLPPQPERTPYVPAAPLVTEARWYAGDFHVHTRESGDARPGLDEVATFARGRGLDFVELSEHNTISQLDFIVDAQSRHPELLLMPGVEWTSYQGHGNAMGVTDWVDHKTGLPGVTAAAAIDDVHAQGGLFGVNHPVLDVGTACIGCAWHQEVDPMVIDAVEIGSGGWKPTGWIFHDKSMLFWDGLCDLGVHTVAIGGSDDHKAGVDLDALQSPIGAPTTMVFARELSVDGILEGVRDGRTVVKLQGPEDPMIELSTDPERTGDTVTAHAVVVRAVITGPLASGARFVRNGEPLPAVLVDTDPFVLEAQFDAPATGEDRYRVEVFVAGDPRTITNHVWVTDGAAQPAHPLPPVGSDVESPDTHSPVADDGGAADVDGADSAPSPREPGEGGCGCRLRRAHERSSAPLWGLVVLGLWVAWGRRRGAEARSTRRPSTKGA